MPHLGACNGHYAATGFDEWEHLADMGDWTAEVGGCAARPSTLLDNRAIHQPEYPRPIPVLSHLLGRTGGKQLPRVLLSLHAATYMQVRAYPNPYTLCNHLLRRG